MDDARSKWLTRLIHVTLQAFVTLVGVIIGLNLLVALAPGDAIDAIANGEQVRDELARQWGLDQPILERITHQVLACLQFDFGTSLVVQPGESVGTLMGGPGFRSSVLVALALIVTIASGTLLAYGTAIRGYGRVRLFFLEVLSVPPLFLTAALLIDGINSLTWTAIEGDLIDRPAYFALPLESSWIPSLLALLLLSLGSGVLSETHASMHRVLSRIDHSPYVMASRAQGRSTKPHFLWNAIIPTASIAAKRLPLLIGSLVILDPVFNLNGIGRLFLRAANARDFPLLIGVGVIAVAFIILARWLVQVLEFTIDPRRRERGHA